jgi:RHS repeat-associated protein
MKRGLVVGAVVCLVALAGCTSIAGTPSPKPPTSGTSAPQSSGPGPSGSTPGTTAGAAEDPALDRCDDLGVVPCPRQVNRVTLPIAGSSIALVYSSDRQPGRTADPAPSAAPVGLGGWSLSDLPGYDPASKREILPDGTVRSVAGVAQGDLTAIADPSGRTMTTFDARGRATATVDALTGLPVARFGWDDHGLASVTDASGGSITITRNSAGDPVALQATGTSPMTFSVAGGQLVAVGYPDGGTVQLDPGNQGLLAGITDASDLRTGFGYDENGRLLSRTDPAGTITTYQRAVQGGAATVTTSVGGARVATDTVASAGGAITFSHTDGSGVTSTVLSSGTDRTVTAAGRSTTISLAPDPHWGMDAPIPAAIAIVDVPGVGGAGGGAAVRASAGRSSQGRSTTSRISVDGKTWTYVYDSTARTITVTDPTGATRTTGVDSRGRVVTTTVQGVPVGYAYDDRGRITTITLGTGAGARTWTYRYDTGSITVTDPLGTSTRETVNAVGIVTAVGGPGGTGFSTSLDTAGRITSFASAGSGATSITWGGNGLPAVVNAPAGQGAPQFTATAYGPTGLPTTVTTADSSVSYQRDAAGRVIAVDQGGGSSIAFGYDASGRLTSAASPGVTLAQAYTGPALTSVTTTVGAQKNEITRTVDGFGRTTGIAINGGTPIGYAYDDAGRLTTAGAMTITRDPATGWISAKKLGSVTESFRYNQFGEPVEITVTGPSGTVATIGEQRDALGRVVARTTKAGSASRTTTYGYDAAGRLVAETTGGVRTTYAYDAAGNLTAVGAPGGATANTYDARNALLRSGSTSYTYDGSGRLATAKGPAGTTTYHYDAVGRLTGVDRPGSPAVGYLIDALGRRVATTSAGGALSGTVAYLDQVRPVASFTAAGAVDAVYVYDGDLQPTAINDGGGSLPAYLTRGGTAYLEIPDVTGGPALVIDSGTGAIADDVDRTALGTLRSETHPGFQIFGYGGGIADPATSLVRIGARDYDTATGRWTAPDPLGIGGGSANLYTFVSGDPVNRTDPRGTCDYTSIGVSAGVGLGPIAGGGSIGIAWGGGQFGTYVTGSEGVGTGGDLSIGITGSCLNSDNGDTSLGNFSGTGSSIEGQVGPISGGSDRGYDSSGNQSSHGGHFGVGAGAGLGGSAQGTFTSIVCLFGCPPPPVTVCGDLGCVSSPGNSASDPASGGGSGSGGIPGSGSRSTGDPHLRTADNTYYDMQAVGEFTWAATDTGSLTVQVRQQPAPGSRHVAINTAFAIAVDGDRVQITPPPAAGQPVAMTAVGVDVPPVGTFTLPHGAIVMRTPTLTTITAADSTKLWIRNNPSGLDIVGAFPDSLKGKVHGLAGPFTGALSGTVQTATGRTLTVEQLRDYTTLYRTYADSWRITQAASLFTDRPGRDATAFDDPTFPDRNPPAVPKDVAAAAAAACRSAGLTGPDLAACELDVAATGDAGYVDSTASMSGVVPGAAPAAGSGGASGTVSGDIVPGKTVSGTVAPGQHTDYRFTVPAGTVGYFAAAPSCDGSASGSLLWTVQDPTGASLIGASVICSDLGRVVFPAAGGYRVVVTNPGSAAGRFSVTWKESRGDQVKALQPGQTASGTIDKPGARDIWTVTVPAGAVAYLAASPSCGSASENAILWHLEKPDQSPMLADSYICSDLGRVVFDTAGTYRLVLSSANGRTAPYAVAWEVSRPDQVKPLAPGQTATGNLDLPGAHDVWTMAVSAGTVVYLAADPACDRSTADAMTWTVTNPDGSTRIGSSYICSDLGRMVFATAGVYRLVLTSERGRTRPYSVIWEVSRPDQVRSLAPGQTATGTIDKPGADDVWTFTATAGTTARFLADPSCNSSTSTNIEWDVLDANGSPVVGSSFICNDIGSVTFRTSGSYRIVVSSSGGGTGPYSFRWAS